MSSKELAFNLYYALAEQLKREGTENIPSIIDQLVGKNCGEYADMYNEYKNQKKKLELYKKALELACEEELSKEGIYKGISFDYDIQFKALYNDYIKDTKEN